MNVNLPYEIGTVLKTMESGKVQYDKVHHYIVGNKIQAIWNCATKQILNIYTDRY